jgi:hypothetical protein
MTARSMTMPLLSIISLAAASSVLDLLRDFLWEVLVDIVPEKKKEKKKKQKQYPKITRYPKHMLDILVLWQKKKKS